MLTQKQQSIIAYLHQASKGVINITQLHAQDIIDLATANNKNINARVEMYQYNNVYRRYDHLQTIPISQEKINTAILESVKHRPVEQFIKYEMYNNNNESEGKIYTIDACFFDKIK